ncbi:MAG: AtpZ/AtpI family protein [bacterium]|nr:AtpZ/AtpI family protein [bacterium]
MGADEKECREAMRYAWAGIEFAITVVMFAAGGFWLDRYLETMPGFTVVLGITGLICAIYRAICDAIAFRKWLAENRASQSQSENDSGNNAGDAS